VVGVRGRAVRWRPSAGFEVAQFSYLSTTSTEEQEVTPDRDRAAVADEPGVDEVGGLEP
jgi:hypothetical protein